MKAYFLIVLTFIVEFQLATAQDRPQTKKFTYKISITDSGMHRLEGYLFNVSDTSLKIGQWPVRFGSDPISKDSFREIAYGQVSKITLKRSHGAGRGAWKGAVIGLLMGVAAGFIEGDDPEEYWIRFTAKDKAIAYGTWGAAVGTGIGALVGGVARKKFIIGGRKENFEVMKINVLNKVYGQ